MIPTAARQALAAHPFLEHLAPEHLDLLAGLTVEVSFQLDEVIFRIGGESRRFYLLLSGLVALEVPSPVRTFRIQTVGEGDELGWSSLLSSGRKQFQARCVDPARALAFDGEQLRALCDRDPAFGYAIMARTLRTVAERLQMTRIQLIDLYKPVGVKPL
jgi:CRP-like cAMP-binding protein